MNSFRESGGGGKPVRSALGPADVELEASVGIGDELMAQQVGLGRVAERLVQHARARRAVRPCTVTLKKRAVPRVPVSR